MSEELIEITTLPQARRALLEKELQRYLPIL